MVDHPFDEQYFQNGIERGTKYSNYLDDAPKNRFYYEVSQAISEVFAPQKTLEIGCAAGIVVSHLASFDIEAHGVDVSEWAVANRFHDSVVNASVDNLPYDDNFFDVVYSIHALEHLPLSMAAKALQEISRVCKYAQIHLMPMLESGPYVGDRFAHLLNLRTDPTHHLLFEKKWWDGKFQETGWKDAKIQIAFAHDTEYFEFGDCQLVLLQQDDPEIARRMAQWNHKVSRLLSQALNGRPTCGLDIHVERLRGSRS